MKKILLADDEEHLRMLVRATLEDDEREILEACDGTQALAMVIEQVPDLVLIDWMMPGLTGPEVVAEIRSRPELERIPVILLTAKCMDGSLDPVRDLRVDAVLSKPFSPVELMGVVEMLA